VKPACKYFLNPLSKAYSIVGILILFALLPLHLQAQQDILDKTVILPRQNNTIYHILNQISRQTGYFFIYDSDLIDNKRVVRIPRTETTIQNFLNTILADPTLTYDVIERHILIHRGDSAPNIALQKTDSKHADPDYYLIEGLVLDHNTGYPLPFASVGLPHRGLGVPTNADGKFRFKIPASLVSDSLRISFMGYKTRYIPMQLMVGNKIEIRLQTEFISIQEVIIRYFDPLEIISRAISSRANNYNTDAVHLLTFYREGVQLDDRLLNYSEAIFKIYNPPVTEPHSQEQVILLKSRNIQNTDGTDTLALKLKAGVRSSLDLNIVRHLPDFLDPQFFALYQYRGAGLQSINGRTLYVIEFRQAEGIREPLFMGVIYIDKANYAIVKAEFEVNPDYLHLATDRFVVRSGRRLRARIQRVRYTVSYSLYDERYHINHVRGDINMRIRHRNQIFGKDFHVFLEMAVSQIETENVSRFRNRETMQTNVIFSQQDHNYDHDFWGEYNIITPEKHITEEILRISSKIESLITSY